MKKTVFKMLVCIMALAFMLGCVSCSLFKNYDYVNEAISKTGALNAATLEILTDIQTTANGTDETISSAYTVSMKDLQSAAPVFSADMNVTLYGETVPASVYYEGGYYYIETADERVKLTSGDLLEKTDFLSDWKRTTKPFTEEILETLIELDHADGTRTVSLLIDPADFQKNHESLLKIWQNTLSEKYGVKIDPQINVSDTKYQMMLDTETNTVKDFVSVCHMDLSGKNEAEENVSVSAFVHHKIVYRATDDAVSLKIPENHTDFELSDGIHYNAYNITKKAVDAALSLEDLDILITLNGKAKIGNNTISIPQTVAVKASGVGTSAWKFRDHTDYTIGETDYYNDIYYENGFYYVRTNDGTPDTKYQATDENYQEYCYQANVGQIVCPLTKSDLSQAKTVKNTDGSKTVTLTLPAVRFQQTHAALAEYFREEMRDPSTFRSSDCEVEITVDHDGNLKLYRLKFVYSGDFSGECDMIMDASVEYYHFGEAVTVETLKGYETFLTVEEQKEAALAKADTAINEMLNADQMILYTYFYEDLMFGNRLVSASEISSRTYATDLQTSPRYRSSWVSIDGEETTEIEVYYANGYFYFWDENDQAKTPANGVPTEFKVPDYLKQHMKPLSDDMKDRAEITNEEDETSWIAIELSSEELQTFIPDVYDMYTEGILGSPISSVELTDAYIYIYFDENGNFVSYEIEYEVDFKANMEGLMDIGFTHYKQICFEFDRSSPITVSPPANYESFPLELMENE